MVRNTKETLPALSRPPLSLPATASYLKEVRDSLFLLGPLYFLQGPIYG